MDTARISAKLRRLRGERTLQDVANEIGITESALSQYETGKRIPRDEIKMALAAHYRVSVDWLFFET